MDQTAVAGTQNGEVYSSRYTMMSRLFEDLVEECSTGANVLWKLWERTPKLSLVPTPFFKEWVVILYTKILLAKRQVEIGVLATGEEFENRVFEYTFYDAFWCPVLKKFLDEGEMCLQLH